MVARQLESAQEKRLCELLGVFSSPVRRAIVKLLASGSLYSFTAILNHLKSIDPSTRSNNLSYHLKELGDLITQEASGGYRITPRGLYIKEILDDLEAAAAIEAAEEGKEKDLRTRTASQWDADEVELEAEKVVVGGLLVKVSPQAFLRLVRESGNYAVHSRIGTFRPKEFYLTCINGLNYYCKSDAPLDGLQTVEASRLEIPKNMIVDI